MSNLIKDKRAQSEEAFFIGVFVVLGIILLLIILSLPVTGNIFGQEIKLPLIGWIGFAVFAVIALYLFFKHRA